MSDTTKVVAATKKRAEFELEVLGRLDKGATTLEIYGDLGHT